MCAWRSDREKQKGPKVGGPSNTKNYKGKSLSHFNTLAYTSLASQAKNRKGSSEASQRSGNSTPALSVSTPTTKPTSPVASPRRAGAPGSPWGRGGTPVRTPVAVSIGTSTSTSTPSNSGAPEPASPGTPSSGWQTVSSTGTAKIPAVTEAGRGISAGTARGAPAWSSRGRGRGRGIY